MDKYILRDDLKVFGLEVKTFPNGIGETFDALVKMVGGFDRSFYGISFMRDNSMVYLATAVEKYQGEAEKYNCERYTIEKGEYLTLLINDWRKKTGTIANVFHEMMSDNRVDKTKPCVEWYKNDDEMLCMVKTK